MKYVMNAEGASGITSTLTVTSNESKAHLGGLFAICNMAYNVAKSSG